MDDLNGINFDRVRIRQVIDNLISNAIKYGPIDSEITIKTYLDEHNHVFEVMDQGAGIPEGKIKNLYEPYFTLGSKTIGGEKSTGLGLSICKNIITSHGGRLKDSAGVQGGSCFKFRIPALCN